MWRLKGCPRCQGDMLVEHDNHGWHEWCLQCGYWHELIGIIKVRSQARAGKGAAKKV